MLSVESGDAAQPGASYRRQVVVIDNAGWNPFTVHGQVTNPSFLGVFDIKTANGIQRVTAPLGDVVRQSMLDKPLPVASRFVTASPAPPLKFRPDPGGILITTTNEYETDTSQVTQTLRRLTRTSP
jgi:hypothetical protein